MATRTKPEAMATRRTADGKLVQFWTDGAVTVGLLAVCVRGCGVSRSESARDLDRVACWLLAGEVTLYDAAELPAAVKAARRAARVSSDPVVRLTRFRELANRAAEFPAAI